MTSKTQLTNEKKIACYSRILQKLIFSTDKIKKISLNLDRVEIK